MHKKLVIGVELHLFDEFLHIHMREKQYLCTRNVLPTEWTGEELPRMAIRVSIEVDT